MAEIDFEACMRYVQGESSLEEAKAVRAWLKKPENELLAQYWMSMHENSADSEPASEKQPAFNYTGMRANLHNRMGLDTSPAQNSGPAFGWRRWAAAAAVISAVGAGGLLYQQRQAAPALQYATGNEQTREVQLPDGSVVTMNANSTLRYAAEWSQDKPREVWLDGEAYFSIKHLPNHQRFRVHTTGNFNVEVLGTKFTVYRRHAQERVVLLSGKVRVDFNDQARPDVILKPGELLQTRDAAPAQVVHKAVKAPAYAAFTAQKLVFDDTPITDLATQLHDTYGVDVVVQDTALGRQTITGTIPMGDLDLLCRALEASFGFKVERQPGRILLAPR
jgi:transmembrane sensor